MTKYDLKTGMVVVLKSKLECIVYKDTELGTRYKLMGFNSFLTDDNFNDTDISSVYSMPSIYSLGKKGKLLYKHQPIQELTIAQIEAKLGCRIKVIKEVTQ